MAEPNAISPLFFGSGSGGVVWVTASNLGLYVQLKPVHIRLQALPVTATYIHLSGNLPAGLTFNGATGIISGTMPVETSDQVYTFVVSANNAGGSVPKTFYMTGTVTEENAPWWQTPAGNLGSGNSGDDFVANLLAIDPSGLPVGYALANSTLPTGLSLNHATGIISGVLPSVSADTDYTFTVDATNAFYSVPRTFDIEVLLNPSIHWITPAGSLSVQLQNTNFTSILLAKSPSSLPITYTVIGSGILPPGTQLDPRSGVIFGTLPIASNTSGDVYSFTVLASDGTLSVPRTFSVTVLTSTGAVDNFADDLLILMHFDGTQGSTTFIDTTGNPVTDPSTDAQIANELSLFGGGSVYFDGSGRLNNHPRTGHDFDLSATDYTIEFAATFDTIPNSQASFFQISSKNLVIGYETDTLLVSYIANGASTQTTYSFPWTPFAYVWNRIAVVSANTVVTVYIDGTSVGNTTIANMAPGGAATPATIGADGFGNTLTGYMDELRVTRAARYLSNYTPSNVPFPDVPYWLTTSPLPSAISQESYLAPLLGNDPNGNGLTFMVANGSAAPSNLSVTSDGGTLPSGELQGRMSFHPTAGSYTFVMTLYDNFNSVPATFILPIRSNLPPTFPGMNLGTYVERYAVATAVVATDGNGLTLSYTHADNAMANTLTLSSTGGITGTAPLVNSNTVDTFAVTASNGAQATTATFTITFVPNEPPVWTNAIVNATTIPIVPNVTTTLFSGYDGTSLPGMHVVATDVDTGISGITVSYSTDPLTVPPGVVLGPEGSLTGFYEPTTRSNSYTFVVNATDGYYTVPATFIMNVVYNIPPTWVTTAGALANVVPTVEYANTVVAIDTNTPNLPITYSLQGMLPPGLTLNTVSGLISGLQTGVASTTTFPFTVEANNGYKHTLRDFSITVPLSHDFLNPDWLPGGLIANVVTGQSISDSLPAISNLDLSPITYSVTGGTLPVGVGLEPSTGLVVGQAPPQPATDPLILAETAFTFTAMALTATGYSVSQTFIVQIGDTLPIWTPDAASGTYYGASNADALSISATFHTPVVWSPSYHAISGLPSGLTINPTSGNFIGTFPDVTANTVYTLVANATDGINQILGTYTIDVVPSYAPLWVTPAGLLVNNTTSNAISWITPADLGTYPAQIGYDLSMQATTGKFIANLAATDPQGFPLTYRVTNGSLPSTLALSATGEISGTMLANDAATFTVTATDSIPKSNSRIFIVRGDTTVDATTYSFVSGTLPDPSGTFVASPIAVATGTFPAISAVPNTVSYTFSVQAYNGVTANTRTFTVETLYPVPYWVTPPGNIYTAYGDTKISPAVDVFAASPIGRPISYTVSDVHSIPFPIVRTGNVFTGIMPTVVTDTTYTFVVNATDGHFTFPQTFTIVAEPNPYLSWQTPAGTIATVLGGQFFDKGWYVACGEVYRFFVSTAILANSASGNITYTITDGTLPGGPAYPVSTAATLPSGISNVPPISDPTYTALRWTPFLGNWHSPVAPMQLIGALQNYTENTMTTAPDTTITTSANGVISYPFTVTANTAAGFAISRTFNINVLNNVDFTDNNDFIDIYANSVVALLHFDGAQNIQDTALKGDWNIQFKDETLHTWGGLTAPGTKLSVPTFVQSPTSVLVGDPGAYISTCRPLYGVGSLCLDGHTGIATAHKPEFDFSTTSFTVECSLYFPTMPLQRGAIFACDTFFVEYFDQQVIVNYSNAANGHAVTQSFSAPFIVNTWYSIALQLDRNSQTMRFFINGSPYGFYNSIPNFGLNGKYTWATCIGCRLTLGPAGDYLGPCYIDEFRLSNVARYTGVYIVSQYPFPTPPTFNIVSGSLGSVLGGMPSDILVTATNPYNQMVNPSNGVLFTVYNGSLPDNMNMLANGLIQGTPDNPSTDTTFNFAVEVTDGINPVIRNYSIVEKHNKPPVWVIAPGLLANVVSGTAVSVTAQAQDPENEPLTYTLVSGVMPNGVTINATTGVISGTTQLLSTTEPFFFTLGVSDGVNPVVTRNFTIITVGNGPPVWQTPAGILAYVHSGGYVSNTVVATDINKQRITYTMVSGSFPPGPNHTIGVTAPSNHISGYAVASTTTEYDFVMSASNGFGTPAIRTFALVISPSLPPVMTNPGTTFWGLGGLAANAVVTATDPQGLPLTFAEGNPSFLIINAVSGAIGATLPNPAGGHTYPFVVTASNQAAINTATYHYNVAFNYAPVWTTDPNLGSYNAGSVLSLPIIAIDPEGYPIIYATGSGSIPGLRYSNVASLLTGTLGSTSSGNATYTMTISASDGVTAVPRTFNLTIYYSGPPLFGINTITPTVYNSAYTYTFVMKPNAISGVSFTMTGGSLPIGLTFNANGTITGTPNVIGGGGPYTFVVEASNTAGVTDATFTLPYLSPVIWTTPVGGMRGITIATFVPSYFTQSVQITTSSEGGYIASYGLVPATTGYPSFVINSNPPQFPAGHHDILPPNMTLDPTTGIISGSVLPSGVNGNAWYEFTVQAYLEGYPYPNSTTQYAIYIAPHLAPTITGSLITHTKDTLLSQSGTLSFPTTQFFSGDIVNYQFTAVSAGSFPLTFTSNATSAMPSGLSLTDNGNGTANVSGAIDQSVSTGTYAIKIDVNDGALTSTGTYSIAITQVSTPTWNNVYNGGNLAPAFVATSNGAGVGSNEVFIILAGSNARSLGTASAYISGPAIYDTTGSYALPMVTSGPSYGALYYGNLIYNHQIPLTLTKTAGSFPSGFNLAYFPTKPSGGGAGEPADVWAIYGTPPTTQRGQSYAFTITATFNNNALSLSSSQNFAFTLPYLPPSVASGPIISGLHSFRTNGTGVVNESCSATDPNGLPVSFALTGNIPPGLNFVDNHNNTAALSGTVLTSDSHGTYAMTVVTSNGHFTNSVNFSMILTA